MSLSILLISIVDSKTIDYTYGDTFSVTIVISVGNTRVLDNRN